MEKRILKFCHESNTVLQRLDKKVLATLLSHDKGEYDSCQLRGLEQVLLDELLQAAATVLWQYTAMCRTLTFIGIVRAP